MDIWVYIIIILLFAICLYTSIKLHLTKKAFKEIIISLTEILRLDTNNLISVSSSNRKIKKLANTLNMELKNFRKEKLQYLNGNQELKKIVTNISHDMRTPLTAINGYIDLIKENKTNIDKQYEYIEIIERKINDLILLTKQLFDFSVSIDMEPKIKKEKCCINNLLEESLANYYSIFMTNNIIPQVELCENKIYKNLDKKTIIRVFENILSNISKYSNGYFKVVLNNDGKIIFSNKALSLDAITVQKIFDRYFTVENAKKSTGIGLSIAKQLVELNNGKISAKYINGDLIIEIEF